MDLAAAPDVVVPPQVTARAHLEHPLFERIASAKPARRRDCRDGGARSSLTVVTLASSTLGKRQSRLFELLCASVSQSDHRSQWLIDGGAFAFASVSDVADRSAASGGPDGASCAVPHDRARSSGAPITSRRVTSFATRTITRHHEPLARCTGGHAIVIGPLK